MNCTRLMPQLFPLFLLTISLMHACAGFPSKHNPVLAPDEFDDIKNLGIITILRDADIQVFDVGGIQKNVNKGNYGTYQAYQYGALGVLLEQSLGALFKKAEGNIKTRSALGGNPDSITENLADFPIKEIFEKNLIEVLVKRLESDNLENIFVIDGTKTKGLTAETPPGIDTLMKIEFTYGLGASLTKKPRVAVSAHVSLINLTEDREILKGAIGAVDYYRVMIKSGV